MKLLLFLVCSLMATDAFELVASDTSKEEWSRQAALERAMGFRKDVKSLRDTRIIGGRNATSGRYPYYTYLELTANNGDVFICSASLVWEDAILTAAHCVVDILSAGLNITGVDAYVGLEDQNNRDNAELRQVELSVIHPDYNVITFENDIAVFKLKYPVLTIDPVHINFDSSVPPDGVGVDTFGFGVTSTDTDAALPAILQTVSLSIIPFSDCNGANSFNGDLNITVEMCAGFPGGGKDACDGDSGSPLIIPGADAAGDIQVGITSFGEGCGDANFPGVYTRISTYVNFIFKALCSHSDNPPIGCDASPVPTNAPTRTPTRAPTSAPTSVPTPVPISQPPSPVLGGSSTSPVLGGTLPKGGTKRMRMIFNRAQKGTKGKMTRF